MLVLTHCHCLTIPIIFVHQRIYNRLVGIGGSLGRRRAKSAKLGKRVGGGRARRLSGAGGRSRGPGRPRDHISTRHRSPLLTAPARCKRLGKTCQSNLPPGNNESRGPVFTFKFQSQHGGIQFPQFVWTVISLILYY